MGFKKSNISKIRKSYSIYRLNIILYIGDNIRAIILSAGKGKRMSDFTKKPLIKLIDKPIIEYIIDELKKSEVDEICIVKSPDIVMNYNNITYYTQPHSLGSADALRYVPIKNDMAIVLPADIPLFNHQIINKAISFHLKNKNESN